MAKTFVKFNKDTEGGMAKQVKTTAQGNAPGAGPVKTPPPNQILHVRGPSAAGYGMNNDPNASSVDPGKAVMSPLAANLKSSVDDDGVLDTVIARGTARSQTIADDKQLRAIADKNVPDHPHMRPANAGGAPMGTIPNKIGANINGPVRKP
jgi:hypothetical protein